MTAPLNVWYLDDGTIAGPADTVAADLHTLRSALSAVGLTLNATKCEVAFLGAPDSAFRGPAIATVRAALPDVKEIQYDNLSLLGSPLTDGSIAAAGEAASALVARLCARLRGLDSHSAVFFLAHHVSAPRLTTFCAPRRPSRRSSRLKGVCLLHLLSENIFPVLRSN